MIENNYEFNFGNNSNSNIYDINDISQNFLKKNENKIEVYKNAFKQIFHEEKDNNNTNQAFNPLDNSNIIIENQNTNFPYEDKIGEQNLILNIFTRGEYDIYSNNIINEALNDMNKIGKKIKKSKKIFIQFPKQIKKKKKNIKHRKDNADNIRKKIKVRFHKNLKNSINEKLQKAGSKYIFKALPQSFITNITKKINEPILDLPIKVLFSLNFKDRKNKAYNLFVLEYLDNHKDISEKANFNKIKNMKYQEAFNEYLLSKEFKLAISRLKKEKENDKYIKKYIIKAYSFINFLKHDKKKNFIFSN